MVRADDQSHVFRFLSLQSLRWPNDKDGRKRLTSRSNREQPKMPNSAIAPATADGWVNKIQSAIRLEELHDPDGGPFISLRNVLDNLPAGYLRLWAATDDSLIDRLVHFRLQSPPVDTHLLFLFGRSETAMPHFHGQVVQFAVDACVYNADIMPRLDPVDHPNYFRQVFGPVTKAYWKAATDRNNVCSMAPANPAISVYLSPWSIQAGRPTTCAELERVAPSIDTYIDQCLTLAYNLDYDAPDAAYMRDRDARHLALFHSEELDPRAWNGVYRVIGKEAGQRIKQVFSEPLR